jgi:hypothetical protein
MIFEMLSVVAGERYDLKLREDLAEKRVGEPCSRSQIRAPHTTPPQKLQRQFDMGLEQNFRVTGRVMLIVRN